MDTLIYFYNRLVQHVTLMCSKIMYIICEQEERFNERWIVDLFKNTKVNKANFKTILQK